MIHSRVCEIYCIFTQKHAHNHTQTQLVFAQVRGGTGVKVPARKNTAVLHWRARMLVSSVCVCLAQHVGVPSYTHVLNV